MPTGGGAAVYTSPPRRTQTNYSPNGQPAYYQGGPPTIPVRPPTPAYNGPRIPSGIGMPRTQSEADYLRAGQYVNTGGMTYGQIGQLAGQARMGDGMPYGTNTPMYAYAGGPGGGGRGGGGGGGGGGAPAGLDQATFDWLVGALGRGRPEALAFNPLDLPDPRTYYGNFDTSMFDQARQGVTSGIDAIRQRGNTAYDQAQGELMQYRNPYEGGLQTQNPDLAAAMQRMMAANQVGMGDVNQVAGEGVQADRAMGNTLAMLAATDQARQAGNLRALAGDRRTTEQNLGIEGMNLGLGVDMAQGRAKSAFDQRLADARFNTEMQERMANYERRNAVDDTNVGNRNAFNQGLTPQLLELIMSRNPGVTLPDLATLFGPAVIAGRSPVPPGLLGTGPADGSISTNPVRPGGPGTPKTGGRSAR